MPYRGGELADLAPPLERAIGRMARQTTEKVGADLKNRVRRHTPVARQDAAIRASYPSRAAWIKARGGREPGTLRDSWIVGELKITGHVYSIPVLTYDPIGPHVEWPTRPHFILPKHAERLTIPTVGGMALSTGVEHPGTQGSHMMATAIAEIAESWQSVGKREWVEISRRVWEE